MQHESVRKYHESIPPYLVNRPHPLVGHALSKIEKAKGADLTGIVIVERGKFLVTSFTQESGQVDYDTSFGDEDEMPHCTCHDWRKSSYLCKHFYAIFRKYPQWGWDQVSPLYRTSPFTTLDPSCLPPVEQNTTMIPESVNAVPRSVDVENSTSSIASIFSEDTLVQNQHPSKYHAKFVQRKLKSIASMVFTLEDQPDVISELGKTLENLEIGLKSHLSVEDGLVLRSADGRGDAWESKKPAFKCNPLPVRRKKSTAQKRVGNRAQEMLIVVCTLLPSRNMY